MAGIRSEKLLTASDLAHLCEVDLKTIHNWVERGRIPHFRTPGRHLRFRAPDVAEFLRAWGYAVPREIARASEKSVLVIGSKETHGYIAWSLGPGIAVKHASHPYDGLVFAGAEPAEVYVIDFKAMRDLADVAALGEAIARAQPQSTVFAFAEDAAPNLPSSIRPLPRTEVTRLRELVAPREEDVKEEGTAMVDDAPRVAASGR